MSASQWITAIIAVVTILANSTLAVWSSRSARRAQDVQSASQRLLAIEDRTAEKKIDTYVPLLQALGDILTPSRKDAAFEKAEDIIADFQTSVIVWGSDEVLTAFARWRIFSTKEPPAMVMFRLIADLEMAMRKDLAWPDTGVLKALLIGMRINDLGDHPEVFEAMTIPLKDLCVRENWAPPVEI